MKKENNQTLNKSMDTEVAGGKEVLCHKPPLFLSIL